MSNTATKISPWAWIPTLYMAEGLPYFAVNILTVLMYVKLGVSKADMAFYTGWLYLPWVIKPFWSPFVDLFGTKRQWVLICQAGICISMAAVAFLLPTGFFFASTLAVFWAMGFLSATHDIAADGYYMLALTTHDQAAYVGIRSTFYRIAGIVGQGLLVVLAGQVEMQTDDIPLSWSVVFGVLSIFFLCVTLWHTRFLPKAASDRPQHLTTAKEIAHGFAETFVKFFRKPHALTALLFMLLYRLPEAMLIKMVQPFMVDPVESGGLGLTTTQVGFANGTVGVVALLAGGIVGGLCIARYGLKRSLWPMALALTLPSLFYCAMATTLPQSFLLICSGVAVEQFGYGFGFTAYMLYMIYFAEGPSKTSHYAFCTAFMAAGMMLPGMAAGWVYERLEASGIFGATGGYIGFFWWVMLCSLATFLVCLLVRIPKDFGIKRPSK